MKLISENKLYDLLRIENLWKLANYGWIPDGFFDFLEEEGYFEKEEACTITKLMNKYEDYSEE